MLSLLRLLWSLTPTVTHSSGVSNHPVQQYVATWNSSIPSADTGGGQGAFSGSPYVGNGDLGVSLAANSSTGEITLYVGLNQMWGLRTNYSANA